MTATALRFTRIACDGSGCEVVLRLYGDNRAARIEAITRDAKLRHRPSTT